MRADIKQKLEEYLDSELVFEDILISSKNRVLKITANNKHYILKIFNAQEMGFVKHQKSHLLSFQRELNALKIFSKFDEVPNLLTYGKDWYLTNYFSGKQLKYNINSCKKALDFIIKIHNLKTNSGSNAVKDYKDKLEEAKLRLNEFLPQKYCEKKLFKILDAFSKYYKIIKTESNCTIHGDFVNRNILVNKNILIIDWENSRLAPSAEDLVFFIESLKISLDEKKELINYYNQKTNKNHPNKIYKILELFFQYRLLGTTVRIKHKNIDKYSEKIEKIIENIYSLDGEINVIE
ncbi:aminoglycoside phosphotransferase family protein [Candidatus Woesearchaeota archaeon]|jgi:predicted Ser/Thr protein kinase|nr:aminoglycoside phosphotransferase family protein [Candidatus Woesearchaeota archaeon]MBT6518532.1 aminoglycoside phosphotransferase family protein [Candidatus Woesearchaeota archaeon]MBT7368404.1 aminoglycoside phosphotransferase family protein [Candidatus Woesearchaeota archaeon]